MDRHGGAFELDPGAWVVGRDPVGGDGSRVDGVDIDLDVEVGSARVEARMVVPFVAMAADHEHAGADFGDAAEAGQVASGDECDGYAVIDQAAHGLDRLGQWRDAWPDHPRAAPPPRRNPGQQAVGAVSRRLPGGRPARKRRRLS